MNYALLKNPKTYIIVDKDKTESENDVNRENYEAIIPLHNKCISISQCYKKNISNITISNTLYPTIIQQNGTIGTKIKNMNNVISLKKRRSQLNKKHDTYIKNTNDKDMSYKNDWLNAFYSFAKSFAPIKFEKPIRKNEIENINFEKKVHATDLSTGLSLENNYKVKGNKNVECFNYSMCNISQNELTSNYNVKHTTELNKNIETRNNIYSNKTQITNHHNVINFIQINTKNEPIKIIYNDKKKLENRKYVSIKNDSLANKVETLNKTNIKINDESDKINVDPRINHECVLKNDTSLSLIDDRNKITVGGLKQNNKISNNLGQYMNNINVTNPLINNKIKKKKKKKKSVGTCFLSLNNFSCQFLISCNKT
ncbi:conserved protein, unknown function [Hepatocystis sp. ex Piliocolobus tephrosceles]|nr:conserved protein, unknown function [Hepatocystis sp. ex Piliocolobus tephrosceles]